ncbi:MAG: hypothetical protein M1829_003753 [Trizodia sp. TS-e1964]|nr:MAG: hypothetical protein M1829_003753 [Trizodia sp. TS-e1964]
MSSNSLSRLCTDLRGFHIADHNPKNARLYNALRDLLDLRQHGSDVEEYCARAWSIYKNTPKQTRGLLVEQVIQGLDNPMAQRIVDETQRAKRHSFAELLALVERVEAARELEVLRAITRPRKLKDPLAVAEDGAAEGSATRDVADLIRSFRESTGRPLSPAEMIELLNASKDFLSAARIAPLALSPAASPIRPAYRLREIWRLAAGALRWRTAAEPPRDSFPPPSSTTGNESLPVPDNSPLDLMPYITPIPPSTGTSILSGLRRRDPSSS